MERKVKLVETSLEAFRALTPEILAKDYQRIIHALKCLKLANYEAIAKFCGWDDINKCSRRLKELESMQIIYKPGSKSLTKRQRQAFNYSLVENNEISATPERQMKGESISDISKKISSIQPTLF